eukprot:NODE_5339_length_515_cov_67.497854_g3961_i0.p3 GENE.NODE_5339_length_515_cov_67.497854_g3961_i0~~NODE_5339_length_515_cov_67.497854_g3961_i0.p3  ORF type:complete len:73 (-),score=9.10 NODE_5339_length_515_cov_67.497854_g3961_i0:131-349(-)
MTRVAIGLLDENQERKSARNCVLKIVSVLRGENNKHIRSTNNTHTQTHTHKKKNCSAGSSGFKKREQVKDIS